MWNFGNDIANVTTNDFGGDAQYGTPDVARFAGTLTSPVMANPALAANCAGYLYFDDVHPTTFANQLLAQQFSLAAAVPEPGVE